MSVMIKRVARAIAKANDDDDYDRVSEAVQELYREEARDAIAAMREPTAAMVDAALLALPSPDHVWRVMIDAALGRKANADSQTAQSGLEH